MWMLQYGIRASVFNTEPRWVEQVELKRNFTEVLFRSGQISSCRVSSYNMVLKLGKSPNFGWEIHGEMEKFGQVVRYYYVNICSNKFEPRIGWIWSYGEAMIVGVRLVNKILNSWVDFREIRSRNVNPQRFVVVEVELLLSGWNWKNFIVAKCLRKKWGKS